MTGGEGRRGEQLFHQNSQALRRPGLGREASVRSDLGGAKMVDV